MNFLRTIGLVICLTAFSIGLQARTITIGLQPSDQNEHLVAFQEELGRRIGSSVKTVVTSNYEDLVAKFSNGEVDFAFVTAVNFIQTEKDAGAKVLLKKVYWDTEFYYSAVVVRRDSKFRKVADLKGQKFGFVDKASTSGYLYGRVLLRQAGLDSGIGLTPQKNVLDHEFFGTHEASLSALVEKKVAAVSVWADEPAKRTGAWTHKKFENTKDFRVLKYSDPIPNDAFVVRQQYYKKSPDIVLKVMEALIAMSEQPDGIMKKAFNVNRMATATSAHYDSVRALLPIVK